MSPPLATHPRAPCGEPSNRLVRRRRGPRSPRRRPHRRARPPRRPAGRRPGCRSRSTRGDRRRRTPRRANGPGGAPLSACTSWTNRWRTGSSVRVTSAHAQTVSTSTADVASARPSSVLILEVPTTTDGRPSGRDRRTASAPGAPPVHARTGQPVSAVWTSGSPAARASSSAVASRARLVARPSPARQTGAPSGAMSAADRSRTASRAGSTTSESHRPSPAAGGPHADDSVTTGSPCAARRSIAPFGGAVQGAMTAATTPRSSTRSCSEVVTSAGARPTSSGSISIAPVRCAASSRPASAGAVTSSASGGDPSNRKATVGTSVADGARVPSAHAGRASARSVTRPARTDRFARVPRPATLDRLGRDGGIGRRAGLKNPWASAREGSTPSPGTLHPSS